MKHLVTGASGLLGGNLVRHIAATKAGRLRVLARENSDLSSLEGIEAEVMRGDIRDRESVDRAVRGCDRVVHCAASVSQWRPNLGWMYEVNVGGTVNVLEAALEAGVERAVYVSTVDTLGLSSRENPADEGWGHESMARFKNPYVDTKYEAELRALDILKRGLDLVIVKPTYMIGEWDTKPTSGQMIIETAKGRVIGYPGGGNNFVDVLDVARGIMLAFDKGRTGESYILGNAEGNLTYKEMLTLIASVVGVRPPLFRIPYPLALAGGYMMDIAGRLTGREPDVNSVTARMGYADHYFTPAKAIKELGLPQSPLAPAVERAYRWFKRRGML